MICEHCAAGADLARQPAPQIRAVYLLAVEQHGRCPGPTWCACQHRVPSLEEIAQRRAALPADRRGLAAVVAMLR